MSCCGLLLSARTEHQLNERNAKRGLTRIRVGQAGNDGGNNGDATDDAACYYQDDCYTNRKLVAGQRKALLNDPSIELNLSTTATAQKHHFNGIMKMRNHKEQIFRPAKTNGPISAIPVSP